MIRIRTLIVWALSASSVWAADPLPKPDSPFQGKIDPSRDKSKPDWPQRPTAPKGAPNVVLILLDDVSCGATSTFGGPVATPFLNQLAADGLRYHRFHVAAMCSPTRGALLCGRNSFCCLGGCSLELPGIQRENEQVGNAHYSYTNR